MKGYLDVHSHILPEVDDGAVDWNMTRKMLNELYHQGVRYVVATPHNNVKSDRQDSNNILKLCSEADRIAKEIDKDFHVLHGNEISFRQGIVEKIENGSILTLADTSYLLIEFLPEEDFEVIFNGLRELRQKGYYPIVAHMERVRVIYESDEIIERLLDMGCYLQVNCKSVMGSVFNKKSRRLQKLILHNKIQFLGSDCHNIKDRAPIMSDCIGLLYDRLPRESVDRLVVQNCQQFLNNQYI